MPQPRPIGREPLILGPCRLAQSAQSERKAQLARELFFEGMQQHSNRAELELSWSEVGDRMSRRLSLTKDELLGALRTLEFVTLDLARDKVIVTPSRRKM